MKSKNLFPCALFLALLSVAQMGVCAELSFDGPGQLVVHCDLDGYAGQCQFDTGARISTANADLVGQNWLSSHPIIGTEELAGFAGIIEKYPVTKVKTIRIDELSAQSVSFVLNRVDESSNIGGNLIAAMTNEELGLYFDFDNMKLESAPQAKFKSLQPLRVVRYTPLMPASIGDKPVTLVWDTGNTSPTLISQQFIADNPALFSSLNSTANSSANAADDSGQNFGQGYYLCKQLRVGDLTFKNVIVLSTDVAFMNKRLGAPFQGVIGEDVIVQANWYLNYQTLKWSAKPAAKAALNKSNYEKLTMSGILSGR